MATLVEVCANLMRGIADLLVAISGSQHGILQGSHEAVLAEAQGAQIGADGFDHLTDLRNTLRSVTAREDALKQALDQLAGQSRGLAIRVRAILDPLLRQSAQYRSTMIQTEQTAVSLSQTDGTRLSGVIFGQGGPGAEVGRSAKSLISTQMQQRSTELTNRGIEPRLIPAARSGSAQVLAAIRQLPITIRDAADKVVGLIAAIRLLLAQAARAALVAGNAALSAALTAIEAALVRAGTRLVTPILVINIRSIRRAAGLPDTPDDA